MSKSVVPKKKNFRIHVDKVSFRDLREEEGSTPPQLTAKFILDTDSSRSKEEVYFTSKDGGKQLASFKLSKGLDAFWYEVSDLEYLYECMLRVNVYATKNIIMKTELGHLELPLHKVAIGPRRQELLLRHKGKVTGRIDFDIEMTQICQDTACLMTKVGIKGWNGKAIKDTENLLLQYQYDETGAKNGHRGRIYQNTVFINQHVDRPTWTNVDLVTFRAEFPRMQHAKIIVKVSREDPVTREVSAVGLTKLSLSKYYHASQTVSIKFKEQLQLDCPDPQYKDLFLEGNIMFLDGPQLCQTVEGRNTQTGFVGPKYPVFPSFDFGRFEIDTEEQLTSSPKASFDETKHNYEDGEKSWEYGGMNEEDEEPVDMEEQELQEEYKNLLFQKQKSVEVTQKHLLKVRNKLNEELRVNRQLDNDIKDLEFQLRQKLEEELQMKHRLAARERGVSREMYKDQSERPQGRESWLEAFLELENKPLETVEGRVGDLDEEPDYVRISTMDYQKEDEGSQTASEETTERTRPEPLIIDDRPAEPEIQFSQAEAPQSSEPADPFDDHKDDMPPPPQMKRNATIGETMYEVPTEVVNTLMRNFEDERSVMKLLRLHGGDPDRVYEWLAFQLGVPPNIPQEESELVLP